MNTINHNLTRITEKESNHYFCILEELSYYPINFILYFSGRLFRILGLVD